MSKTKYILLFIFISTIGLISLYHVWGISSKKPTVVERPKPEPRSVRYLSDLEENRFAKPSTDSVPTWVQKGDRLIMHYVHKRTTNEYKLADKALEDILLHRERWKYIDDDRPRWFRAFGKSIVYIYENRMETNSGVWSGFTEEQERFRLQLTIKEHQREHDLKQAEQKREVAYLLKSLN